MSERKNRDEILKERWVNGKKIHVVKDEHHGAFKSLESMGLTIMSKSEYDAKQSQTPLGNDLNGEQTAWEKSWAAHDKRMELERAYSENLPPDEQLAIVKKQQKLLEDEIRYRAEHNREFNKIIADLEGRPEPPRHRYETETIDSSDNEEEWEEDDEEEDGEEDEEDLELDEEEFSDLWEDE